MFLHEGFCLRNNKLCPECNKVFLIQEFDEHLKTHNEKKEEKRSPPPIIPEKKVITNQDKQPPITEHRKKCKHEKKEPVPRAKKPPVERPKIKPRVIAISYSDQRYQTQLKFNKKSALEVGKVDIHYSYGPDDIDSDFKQRNKDILSRKRGNGYWLWKPYFINKTLIERMNEGDYLIYTDACVLYLNSTKQIIDTLKKKNLEMWMNKLPYIEKQYTKRDAFILMGTDSLFYTDTNQYAAYIQIYKKSKYTEKFVEELLYYSQDKRIITDDKNTLGFQNYKEFRDNRHDQTVLSLLPYLYK
jgi:hypothetical protein